MRTVAVIVALVVAACGAPPPPAAPPAAPSQPPVIAFVSPGPLIAVHGSLSCGDCHADSTPAISNTKCVGCHEGVRARITAGRGLHAGTSVRGKSCSACHLDHRGADYSASGWTGISGGATGFDHARTGWPLEGVHATTECTKCHTVMTPRGRPTFLAADRNCSTCHQTQPHGFERRELLACGRCHTAASWAPAKRTLLFNHDLRADAGMPLRGVHRKVECKACHPANQFNLPAAKPTDCESCHRSPHAGQIHSKQACEHCHSETTFKSTAFFDHSERTQFDLGTSHRKLACATCHTPALGAKPPSAACESCHAKRAPHKDRFKAFGKPPACALCHTPANAFDPAVASPLLPWRSNRIDPVVHAKWPLTQKHAQATCRACHRGSTPTDFERFKDGNACMSCHQHATVHADETHPNGRFTNAQCRQCHVSDG